MRNILIILILTFICIQNISAQTNHLDIVNVKNNIDNVDLILYPNPVEDILNLKTSTTIDFIRLYNNEGQLVVQLIPVNNQVSLDDIEPGFYMAYAYKDGKTVKKSILKKI